MSANITSLKDITWRESLIALAGASAISIAIASPLCAQNIVPVQNPNQVFVTPDYTGGLESRSALTGDWGGSRQELANDGVTLDANLTQVTQGVVSGGRDTGWEYSGRGETTLNLDTAKLGFWPGGLLTVMGEGNFGDSLAKKTGSLLGVNANDLLS